MKQCVLSNREISRLCRGLSLLLHAGISAGDGLFLMAEEEEGAYKELLEAIGREMDAGVSLAQAMDGQNCFPTYVTGMVRVGEAAGHLEETLLALSQYYEEQERMMHQIRSALLYPSMLLGIMLVVIGVLLVKVLPVFEEVYASLGGSLTGMAGWLLKAGQVLESILPILYVILVLLAVAAVALALRPELRTRLLQLWQKRYGNRGVSQKINDAHFAQALAMGMRSGMPVEDAIALAGDIVKEIPEAKEKCETCVEGLNRGEGLAQVLKETGILPASSCRMLEMGIRGGSGDQVMEEISGRLSMEASRALEEKVAMVEPVMVMTASLLVGAILLSVMLPLMNIMSAIG